MEIHRLKAPAYRPLGPRIAELEREVEYPLGADRFRIDHGRDYFAFFERMGPLTYFAATEGERLLGVLAAVRCRTPDAWYACDLKIPARERGGTVAARLARAFLDARLRDGTAAYGISMDPATGENRVVRYLLRLAGARGRVGARLRLYSLDAAAMRAFEPALRAHRGELSYLSLAGRKDIVLRSTGRPMPLLHVQFGPRAERGFAAPLDEHVHMFCTPADDALDRAARAAGLAPNATATLVHAGLDAADWSFVLTSDV